jgi:hypothetical protein
MPERNHRHGQESIKYLQSQITEFGGSDEEDVHLWIERVERLAQVHGASDRAILLTATPKLMNLAKTWYGTQSGKVLDSWSLFKTEFIRIFVRQYSYTTIMQKAEAKNWNHSKESFDQYAIEKMALIRRLNLPAENIIDLLIRGICHQSIRATAWAIRVNSVEQFLETMRRVANGMSDYERRKPSNGAEGEIHRSHKQKEITCNACGRKGHVQSECRANLSCAYCKKKGHLKADCWSLLKKTQNGTATTSTASTAKRQRSTQR